MSQDDQPIDGPPPWWDTNEPSAIMCTHCCDPDHATWTVWGPYAGWVRYWTCFGPLSPHIDCSEGGGGVPPKGEGG